MRRFLLAALLVLASASAGGATINAASCQQAAVTTAITAAADGDIVAVPAGNCTWSGLSVSKGIHLQGAGSATSVITVTSQIALTKSATHNIELSGFTFQASNLGSAMFVVVGNWSAKPFLIHDNIFTVNVAGIMRIEVNGGVIWNNEFISTRAWNNGFSDDPGIQHKIGNATATVEWATPDTMGTNDTNGDKNLYVEDNTFENMATVGMDYDDGARVVFRHNTLTNVSFNSHGLDTSAVGVRHYEIANNTWYYPDNMANLPWVIWLRGGTGVVYNNIIPNVTGQEWGDVTEIQFSVRMANDGGYLGCATGWPAPHQIGQNHNGTNQFLDPVTFWGNTGAGAAVWGIRSWDSTCGQNINDYLQNGRDFVFQAGAKSGYTPYTYPHPLRSAGSDTEAPTTPTSPSATAISASRIDLSWTASTDNTAVTGYDIQRCSGSGCTPSSVVASVGAVTSHSDTGLTASTLYRYNVRARDAANNASSYSSVVGATTDAASAPPTLPEGNNGIAASYINDSGITGNANVMFAEGFETYTAVSQLTSSGNWNSYFQGSNLTVDTTTFNGGGKALRIRMPNSGGSEVSNAIVKTIAPSQDTLFVRAYVRYAANYSGVTAAHNGIRITANYTGPGTIPDGTDFFYVSVEQSRYRGEAEPGYTNAYVYFPEQNDNYGEHWYPSGFTSNGDGPNGGFGQYFVARSDLVPTRDTWICYEVMVQANAAGLRDGRIAVWQDGVLIADWQNIRFRDVDTVKINEIQLENGGQGSNQINDKWIDDIVVAKSYIGPMSALLAAPTNLWSIPW